jgi:hypothetical protein
MYDNICYQVWCVPSATQYMEVWCVPCITHEFWIKFSFLCSLIFKFFCPLRYHFTLFSILSGGVSWSYWNNYVLHRCKCSSSVAFRKDDSSSRRCCPTRPPPPHFLKFVSNLAPALPNIYRLARAFKGFSYSYRIEKASQKLFVYL